MDVKDVLLMDVGKKAKCVADHTFRVITGKPRAPIRKWRVSEHSGYPIAPFPMCFTRESMQDILGTIGVRPPETGAKIFSPWERIGIETVEFDESGSEAAGGAVYSPDTKWGLERLNYHLNQPQIRLWTGDIHSHPGHFGHPSGKSGRGLGDLGYVEEVFAQNEMMEYFFIPILTGTGTDEVTIHPWICKRGTPVQLMIADVKICHSEKGFPERIFNPTWELRSTETTDAETIPASSDADVFETPEVNPVHLEEPSEHVDSSLSRCKSQMIGGERSVDACNINPDRVIPIRAIELYRSVQNGLARPVINIWEFQQRLEKAEYVQMLETSEGIRLYFKDMSSLIVLPDRFPSMAPAIRFFHEAQIYELPETKWLAYSPKSPEQRLAERCLSVASYIRAQQGKGLR